MVKEFDFSIKSPQILTLYQKDQCYLPLNLYNQGNSSTAVSVYCSIYDGEWDLVCPSKHTVAANSVDRTYLTIKVYSFCYR